jgi:hypothetical protein
MRHLLNYACMHFKEVSGLNPTISKNRGKSCFLYTQEISYRHIFPLNRNIFCTYFFGSDAWQDFWNLQKTNKLWQNTENCLFLLVWLNPGLYFDTITTECLGYLNKDSRWICFWCWPCPQKIERWTRPVFGLSLITHLRWLHTMLFCPRWVVT